MADNLSFEDLKKRIKKLDGREIDLSISEDFHSHEIDLSEIINTAEIQSIMNDFNSLTNMVIGICDLKGKVIASAGWQDICTKFHRVDSRTASRCVESDLFLAKNLYPGEYIDYKCKNGLWDVVTPLYVGSCHVGNAFTGQFFYEDDEIDEDFFLKQAEEFQFDKDSYLNAFHLIPRYSRKTINTAMNFIVKLTTYISSLSFANIQLEKEILQRKAAEEKSEKARAYVCDIINSMPSFLIGVDKNGRINQWNRAIQIKTGVTYEQVSGKYLPDIIPRMTEDMELVGKAIKERREQIVPQRHFFDDEMFFEYVSVYPLISDGEVGAVIRIDDITEKVKMEEMVVQSEKMLSIGGLAAGMAHEINNPLAGIIQTAAVMGHRLFENPEMNANSKAAENERTSMDAIKSFMDSRGINRMIASIKESGERVTEIIENMLSFARKDESKASPCNPAELLDNTLAIAATEYDLKKHYDFKKIRIERQYEDNLPVVFCISSKIRQVFFNILSNGAYAMCAAGVENPRFILVVRYFKDRDMIHFEIEDNGPGMEESIRKRIFEPFFTTKPAGIGTGLGLSISYFIITKNHGGELLVESHPGSGTKFIINLPCKPLSSIR